MSFLCYKLLCEILRLLLFCGIIFVFRENDIENFAAFTKKMDDGVRALTGAATDQIKRYSVSKSILN